MVNSADTLRVLNYDSSGQPRYLLTYELFQPQDLTIIDTLLEGQDKAALMIHLIAPGSFPPKK